MSSRSSRVGFVGVLAALVALAAGYLNNCFAGLGLGAGQAPGAVQDSSKDARPAAPAGKTRIVVQGEQCLLAGEATPRGCDVVCAQIAGDAEVDATVGAQRTVDALKACLQTRGVKTQVLSE